MSRLEYFQCYDPISRDVPAHFDFPTYRSYDTAQNYIKYYAQNLSPYPTNYTTGFTRKIQADDPADVEASFNELKNGQMVGKQSLGATSVTSIFCLSYSSSKLEDGTYGLSREDWKRALAIATKTGNSSVVLWVDILDRANRTHPWGEEQLCPYLIYPVIFVATAKCWLKQSALRMWPAMEATMGQLGAGLITDRIAQRCGHFIPFQARSNGLYYSMTVAADPEVEREAFELHIASGRFRGCPTYHQGDYDKLLTVLQLAASRWVDEDGDFFPALDRLELRFNGAADMKLEVTSTRWISTELPGWTGGKEWFPQEGGLISVPSSKMKRGSVSGSYQVLADERWIYCVINRSGKKTLTRMGIGDAVGEDRTLRPEKLETNAYARIPNFMTIAFLGNFYILGAEEIDEHGRKYDLSKVEWT